MYNESSFAQNQTTGIVSMLSIDDYMMPAIVTGMTNLLGLGWTFFLMFMGSYMATTGFNFTTISNASYTLSLLLLWATSGVEFILFCLSWINLDLMNVFLIYGEVCMWAYVTALWVPILLWVIACGIQER